jgi:two-component system NtrC family sensor kinase
MSPERSDTRLARRRRLDARLVAVLLAASLVPLVLMTFGSWFVFGRMLEEKTLELHRSLVQSHAQHIDLYLTERFRALRTVAAVHSLEDFADNPELLRRLLDTLNESYPDAFVDLGVIDERGTHLAYVGPYPVHHRNYAREQWFRTVMSQGSYVSDVFLGFRQVPHCVVAIKRPAGSRSWILRATINSDALERLVRSSHVGDTGDVYIVNAEGRYQTTPRTGRVLDRSSLSGLTPHRDVSEERVVVQGTAVLRATTWLNRGRWLLVVQQDEREVEAPVRRTMTLFGLLALVAVAVIVVTTLLATWHLRRQIERAQSERDTLSKDLLRSTKLASLGELASGLAHEINNPLAILSAEQTNIEDVISELGQDESVRGELLDSVARCKRQIERCAGITARMLQFGRGDEASVGPIDVRPQLVEAHRLLYRQAQVRNIELSLEAAADLPAVLANPTELEQVLINLINNSLQATDAGGRIVLSAAREAEQVVIRVSDTGRGIPAEHLERVFLPFFTTKPPGEGTGLGLSVCYGIVTGWGGKIDADSQPGAGTTITIRLPIPGERKTARSGAERTRHAGSDSAALGTPR